MNAETVVPLILGEHDPRSQEELEKLSAQNLQNIIYQANPDLLKSWLPLIVSALKTGKMGEMLINGFSQYAIGDHEGLKATIRILQSGQADKNKQAVIDYECKVLENRKDFSFGNFDSVIKRYDELSTINLKTLTRSRAEQFTNHRVMFATAFFLQDKEKFNAIYANIENLFSGDFGSISHVNMNTYRAMHLFMSGNYIEANEFALAAVKLSDELKISGAYSPFEAAYILADTYLEFGENKKSLEFTENYLARALEFNQYPWIAAFYAKLSVYNLQEGNISAALSAIRKGRECIEGPLFNPALSLPLDIHELMIRLQLEDIQRINELIPRLPNNKIGDGFKFAIQMKKNPASIVEIAPLMPETNDHEKFHKESILALIYSENRNLAIPHVKKAIELAEKNGYFRSLVYAPQVIRNYILDIAAEKSTIYLEKLSKVIRFQASRMSESYATDHIPLTKRELDVLRRLGTNMPITKIAASMHISNNTIKTHLKNVYRKLNVESRNEAVARGKELSLL